MARPDVIFSIDAEADLDWLFTYIAGASGYPRSAKAYIDRIVDKCERLAEYPGSGRDRPDLGPDLRSLPFEGIVIVYTLHPATVLIVRIFDAKRDYKAILQGTR